VQRLFRYNSVHANSNLCRQCGSQLASADINLLETYRPMELRLTAGDMLDVSLRHEAMRLRVLDVLLENTALLDEIESIRGAVQRGVRIHRNFANLQDTFQRP
jgi:hypothetical protein